MNVIIALQLISFLIIVAGFTVMFAVFEKRHKEIHKNE